MKDFMRNMLRKIRNFLVSTRIHKKFPILVVLYDYLFRCFGSHKSIIEIQGSKMYINVHEESADIRKTFQTYALNRIHEEATTELFKKIVKRGDVVVDLGANIGYFTLLAARLVGEQGRVYAFEPEPRNHKYLLKNIELNGYNNILPMQKAVSDRQGRTKLYICSYDTGHHTINQYEGIRVQKPDLNDDKEVFIEVETTTIDGFFEDKEQSIDVMKIDVEGAEMLVLSGMDKVIKQSKGLKMFVEFFPLFIQKMGGSPREFIRKLLEDYGFSIFIIGQDYDARNRELLRVKSVDHLINFCKDPQDHLNLFIEKA